MQIDMNRFRATFYVEAAEHLEHMEAALLQLENAPQDSELLNCVFRAAHSIKGASTTFGLDEVGRFTHVCENLLDRMRNGIIGVSSDVVEVLLASVDVIQGLINAAKEDALPPQNLEAVLADLNRINGTGDEGRSTDAGTSEQGKTGSADRRELRITFIPSRDFFRFGQEPFLILRELHEICQVTRIELSVDALPSLEEMDPESCYLSWVLDIETNSSDEQLAEAFMFLDEGSRFAIEPLSTENAIAGEARSNSTAPVASSVVACEANSTVEGDATSQLSLANKAASGRSGSGENETLRVDRARLDEMINQIGELVIGASMVQQELQTLTGGTRSVAMDQLSKIVRDLQEMSLSLRMIPIAGTFQKLARVVRDLARKLDKSIEFTTEGEDTELDKTVVDQIGDPLVHMIRNAADHGIEPVAERLAQGKPAAGRILLRAYQQSGNIFIELHDDGRGLNRERILRKAIERGLVSPDETLNDSEICNLIFEPGFSTAEAVTDVSGRGVGMDVVRRNVEALQGSVSVRSEPGKGSVLTVRLPLTLAILDGLLVQLDSEVYVLPLSSVVETISVQRDYINRLASGGEVVVVRGEVLPVFWLRRVLHTQDSPKVAKENGGLLVIVEEQGHRFALVVDDLLGQQQVVIKSLETNLQKVPGVSGATILGNGRVALILDPLSVAHLTPHSNALAS